MWKLRLTGVVVIAAALLTACGGGGGSGSSTPPGPSVTATPNPSPTPITGSVLDIGTQRYSGDGGTAGAGIANATVVVGNTLIVGATPPATLPAGDVATTTNAIGAYTVSGVGSAQYVMVFPAAGDAHVSSHALAKVSNGTIRPLFLIVPTSDDLSIFSVVNSDRASNGSGPVNLDEIAMETARAHADFMAKNGYYQHCIPASNCAVITAENATPPANFPAMFGSPNDLYNSLGGAVLLPSGNNASENLAFNWTSDTVTWSYTESAFMAEKTSNGGHYLNIVDQTHKWVGFGKNLLGLSVMYNGAVSPAPIGVLIQEFYSPTGV